MGYGLGGAVDCGDVERENNCFERDSCDGDSDDQPLDCAVSDVTHVSDTDLSVATQDGDVPRDYAGIGHDALGSDGADEQVSISNACKVGTLNPLAPTWPQGYRGNLSANLSDGSTIEGAVAPLAGCTAGSTVESPNRTPISSVPRDSLAQDSGSLEAQEDDHQKYLINIHNTVRHSGLPNYRSARIPVPSGLNTDAWERYLRGHPDTELLDFLKYGWPVSYDYITPITSSDHNHPSAAQHSSHIDYYITTELGHRAMLGPFSEPPFSDTHFSPMMTRAKKDSPHRRVIVDLSWPTGEALNDGIPQGMYIGKPYRFHLPTVEGMASRLRTLGPGAYMFKTDLERGYRQLRIDPYDWPLLGIQHRGDMFFDICPPFGMRTSALMMQRTSAAITDFHWDEGFESEAYVDDYGGAEADEREAWRSLGSLQGIMKNVGLKENPEKIRTPSQVMTWLGIEFDSVRMIMRVPPPKVSELQAILADWQGKESANKREVQSLLGLLNFVASVAPPARIYTNRMLEFLRSMHDTGYIPLTAEFRGDLEFFTALFPQFNGISVLLKEHLAPADQVELDACLSGCGAFNALQFYSRAFPQWVQDRQHHISRLELLNVVVAARLWAPGWRGKKVAIYCDNMAACCAMTSGRSHDPYLAACVRAIFVCTTASDVELLISHRPGAEMGPADALSRAHLSVKYHDLVLRVADGRTQVCPGDDMFEVGA